MHLAQRTPKSKAPRGVDVANVDLSQASASISFLLQRPEPDTRAVLVLVDEHFRRPVAAFIRQRFSSLRPEELADVWTETVLGFANLIRGQRIDAQRQNYYSLLCTIASRRATDRCRRDKVRKAALSEVLVPLGRALQGTNVGRRWQSLDEAERREVMELIRGFVRGLPAMQRVVMQAFVEHFPDTGTTARLQAVVAQGMGICPSAAAVKRALQEGRRKIRAFLLSKGYDFGKGGAS
jgi:DNA-directed RNA polymerase specialized sigma24 family protein